MPTTIRPAVSTADIEATRALFREYAAALPFSLAYQGFASELAALPAPYVPPGGCLLLARRGGAPLGTIGLKRLGDATAEIKRLYVVPAARGGGLGRMLLMRVIEEARARRYRRVRLDSARCSMKAAIALYRSLGFVEIRAYGPNPDGRLAFFEKTL
jgi:ribosomal protein S18 acetylase RimI-like enzyme